MSTTDIERTLRRAARLRARVEEFERGESVGQRVLLFMSISLTSLVLMVLGLDAWFAYRVFQLGSGSR